MEAYLACEIINFSQFLSFYLQVFYVCQLHKDVENEKSFIFYISEFLLKDPLLSFSIFVAKVRREKSLSISSENDNTNQYLNGGDDSDPDESLEQNNEQPDKEDEVKDRLSVVTLFATNKV